MKGQFSTQIFFHVDWKYYLGVFVTYFGELVMFSGIFLRILERCPADLLLLVAGELEVSGSATTLE